MQEEKHGFQAEVSRLLDIVAHSLYSDKTVFLRELISNASDACDRLRYLSLTQPELTASDPNFRVTLSADRAARTLTIADNGIGMNHDDLVENLGTIARSGTSAFVGQMTGDAAKDLALIGQFGVGFYSAFMVAERVEVTSRKAGEDQGWRWISEGKGEFTVAPAEVESRGTRITLHLREGEDEFLDSNQLRRVVTKYSDHIALPILLIENGKEHTINAASALWTRPKSEITEAQYAEFYRHTAHSFDSPWLTLHARVEGKIEYTSLLFVPSAKPLDLFHPDRKHCVRLYVRRVFITESCEEVLPAYLRFLRGIIDSEDLPLNISREMLQHNPILAKIRAGVTKRVLNELQKKADSDPEDYTTFWNNFGAVLKEGLYEDSDQRDPILKLARFRSTAGEGLVSLADYVGRMKPGQDAIYYITGDSTEAVARSPQLEGFAARGVEVLLLTDPVDEFWVPAVGLFEGKAFKSVTRGGADLDRIEAPAGETKKSEPPAAGIDNLIALFRLTLKDAVKDVRLSQRLTDSPVCLVADEGDMDIHLERLLKQHRQIEAGAKRVLEINPAHPLVASLAKRIGDNGHGDEVAEAAWLLLDQARIVEGETLPDPAAFSRRLSDVLRRSMAA
ncbi:molecular chaperone HtpG [Rhodospirillaceae bacterium SYSU D60014]|uniref:molecular chaperone HtpG n=1 Tax=Virgifigura deserti TaxID=2268457 RepID=UPI000E66A602